MFFISHIHLYCILLHVQTVAISKLGKSLTRAKKVLVLKNIIRNMEWNRKSSPPQKGGGDKISAKHKSYFRNCPQKSRKNVHLIITTVLCWSWTHSNETFKMYAGMMLLNILNCLFFTYVIFAYLFLLYITSVTDMP